MDITERKITKIAREAEKLVLRTLREKDVGTAEIDLIHALRHNPGCTQAALAELLHADKAAIARRTKNLEGKGYLVRRDAPNDRRSQLLYPTEKAEGLKASKAEIEASFYEYLTGVLTPEEAAAVTAALPEDTQNDIYRVLLTGEAEPVDVPALQAALAPRFYALTVRDETRPRRALWEGAEEDTLRGLFLQALKAQYDAAQTEADRRRIALAARCGCAAMDGREAAE